jgi:2-hydroxychromene-2-carboxylate isomerase
MHDDIEFYFDFASPYSYFAARRIEQIAAAHGRAVRWLPVLVTVMCEATGSPLVPLVPIKWQYVQRDLERTARAEGIAYRLPPGFPRLLLAPGRAMLWIRQVHGEKTAAAFARTCLQAYFGDGVDISDAQVLTGIGAALGVDRQALLAGMADDAIKSRFRGATAQALNKGAFGVPFVIADGEAFWGFDRLGQLDAWLGRAVEPVA